MASPPLSLLFILLEFTVLLSADNISIQYVIIHSSSNATSSSYSVSSNDQSNHDTQGGASVASTITSGVDGLANMVTADASDANEATLSPPTGRTMYYNGARGNEHFIAVSYDHQIPGVPGKDYPIYSAIPVTQFKCSHAQTGYFADENSGCQVIHICQEDGSLESFLCPNGTIFNQQYLVCDWWFNVDCSKSKDFYNHSGVDSRSVDSTPLPYLQDQSVSASIQEHTVVYPDDQLSSVEEYTDEDFESQEKRDDS